MKKCKCEDCGKEFNKGQEGDNEKFCLRCERQALTKGMDSLEYEDFDIQTSDRAYPASDDIWEEY